jgi:hypothetical protein
MVAILKSQNQDDAQGRNRGPLTQETPNPKVNKKLTATDHMLLNWVVLVDKTNVALKANAPAHLVVDWYKLNYSLTNSLSKHQLSF